jgi:hypothetical protein
MDLSGEFGFRYLFTDYIDDVSRGYVDPSKLSPEALALSYRGDEIDRNATEEVSARSTLVNVNGKDFITGHGYDVINSTTGIHDNIRGSKNDRDVYTMTTIRLTYILGKTFHKAKFR